MCSSLPVGRVIKSGRLTGPEWQLWGPWDQCFDNKCLLLFGLSAWCLLCYPYRPWRPAWLRRHVRECCRQGQATYTQVPSPSTLSKGCKDTKILVQPDKVKVPTPMPYLVSVPCPFANGNNIASEVNFWTNNDVSTFNLAEGKYLVGASMGKSNNATC